MEISLSETNVREMTNEFGRLSNLRTANVNLIKNEIRFPMFTFNQRRLHKIPSTRKTVRVRRTGPAGQGHPDGLFCVHFLYFLLEISKLFQLDIFRIALECFIFKMLCEMIIYLKNYVFSLL